MNKCAKVDYIIGGSSSSSNSPAVGFGVCVLQQQTYIPCYHSPNIGRLLATTALFVWYSHSDM